MLRPSEKKVKEWKKSAILLGVVSGLSAAVWALLLDYWLGLI